MTLCSFPRVVFGGSCDTSLRAGLAPAVRHPCRLPHVRAEILNTL
jgi:hypothetical protein